jgi:hypothetical protein
VLRQPFDLQKLQAKYPKVRPLLSSLRDRNPEKVLDHARRVKPALAYKAVAAFLEQTPTAQGSVREVLEKQMLLPLRDKITRQITRRQITTAGIALSSLLLLGGAAVYFMYHWGKAEEQARINAFAESIEDAFRKALEIEEQRTNLTEEVDIQSKLSGRIADFDPSFVPLPYPDNINHPRNFSISDKLAIDLSRFPTTAQIIAIAQRSAQPKFGVISTWASDDRLSGPDHTLGSADADFSQCEFTDFYRRVAGAPLIKLSDGRTFYSVIMEGVDFPLDDIPMDFLSVLFFDGKQAKEWHFLPDFNNLRDLYSIPSSAAWQSVYSYTQYFSGEIDTAAGILARAHPDSLRENNVRVFLRDDLVTQLLEMTSEDPWQDRAACIKVGCSQLERLESVYQDYSDKVGVELWGKRRDLPWWAWWLASRTYKYNLEKQALGPAQVIVGLANRAANQREILRRYRPFLSQGDFSTPDDVIRTVLDPRKSIFAKAMVFDYVITELERTLFSDPNFREPATFAPFISDLRTAREYSLMYLASILAMFPEFDFISDKFVAIPHRPFYFVHLLHAADQFKIKLDFPGSFYYRWESPDTVVYSEFLF